VSPLRLFVAAFVLLAGALAVHAWYYLPFFADEAFISLRYAERFASGQGLTWADAERVEGYASFLWVVLNGVVGKVIGFVPSARALGFAGVLVALACLGLEPRGRGVSWQRLLVGGVLLVTTAPMAIAAIGGLEQGLVAGLVALSLRLLERSAWAPEASRPWAPGVTLAALVLLRSDGAFLVAALLAGAACLPRPSIASLRRTAIVAIPAAAALLLQFAFRLAYYGKWLPSSASAPDGLAYAARGYSSASMLVLVAIVASVLAIRRGERFGLVAPWAVVAVTTIVVVLGGGDTSPGFRELVPAIVAMCVLVADEVATDWSRILSQRTLLLPVLGLAALLHASQSHDTEENRRAKAERREWDALAIGRTLKTAFDAKRPLLATEHPFALPFGSEFDSLDLSGWQTPSVADTRKMAQRAPDLVALNDVSKPVEPAARALLRAAMFKERYQWIRIEGSVEPESDDADSAIEEVWVRREHGPLGVVRDKDRIAVPGYFFSGESKAKARLDSTGNLVTSVSPRRPGVLPSLTVPAGTWRIDVVPEKPKLKLDVRCDELSMQREASSGERIFELRRPANVSIAVAPEAGARRMGLRGMTLTKVDAAPTPSTCVKRGQPLRVPAALLAREMPTGVHWAHPTHFLFGSSGAVVELGKREKLAGISLSLTRHDPVTLELRRDGKVVWTTTVDRDRGEGSLLLNNRFDLPNPFEGGSYELVMTPRRGSTPSSIGHLVIH
jgi:hypothetical protein